MNSRFSIQGALFGQSKPKQPPEKPAELTAEQMRQAVERLRAEVQAGLDDGTICPCCDKYVRRYRRKLNASMARSLIWLGWLGRCAIEGAAVAGSDESTRYGAVVGVH